MKSSRQTPQQKALIRRYLIWAYKSTRESFERIERKTTQLLVDEYMLAHLLKSKSKGHGPEYLKSMEEFKQYIQMKKNDELKLKYVDGQKKTFHPQYVYLKNRLAAIEDSIKHFLGPKELKKIEALFETEFTRRILESKDH